MFADNIVHERIQQFINHLQITNNQFAKEIGDSSAKISQVTSVNGSRPDFRMSLLLKILSRFPELSADWLLLGEGPMLKSAAAKLVPTENSLQGAPPSPVSGWKTRLLEAQQARQTIPMVTQKAYASYLAGHADPDFLENQPAIYYPELKGLGPVIAIRVQGESMTPTICPDDVLLCSYVERGQKLQNGSVYVVCNNEGVVVKRVVDRSTQGRIICSSDNPEYPPFEVPLDQIQHLWRVRRRITAFLDLDTTVQDRLQDFEEKLNQLQQRIS